MLTDGNVDSWLKLNFEDQPVSQSYLLFHKATQDCSTGNLFTDILFTNYPKTLFVLY